MRGMASWYASASCGDAGARAAARRSCISSEPPPARTVPITVAGTPCCCAIGPDAPRRRAWTRPRGPAPRRTAGRAAAARPTRERSTCAPIWRVAIHHAALGERDGESAVGAVVRGAHRARRGSPRAARRSAPSRRRGRTRGGAPATTSWMRCEVLAAAQLVGVLAEEDDGVARRWRTRRASRARATRSSPTMPIDRRGVHRALWDSRCRARRCRR